MSSQNFLYLILIYHAVIILDRRLSRKRSQLSLERLKRSFSRSPVDKQPPAPPDYGSMDLAPSPKPALTPTLSTGNGIPDTIVEEASETHNMEMETSFKDTNLLVDVSIGGTSIKESKMTSTSKVSFHFNSIKADEGLGESLDLNSEHSNSSPKVSDKFSSEPLHSRSHGNGNSILEPAPFSSTSVPFSGTSMLEEYERQLEMKSMKRVTFL